MRAVLHGLLVPLIDAGTTGVIVASFWLHLHRTRVVPRYDWTTSQAASLAVAATVQVSLGVTNVYVLNSATSILIYLVMGLALLFWVRIALRTMLLAQTGQSQRGLR